MCSSRWAQVAFTALQPSGGLKMMMQLLQQHSKQQDCLLAQPQQHGRAATITSTTSSSTVRLCRQARAAMQAGVWLRSSNSSAERLAPVACWVGECDTGTQHAQSGPVPKAQGQHSHSCRCRSP